MQLNIINPEGKLNLRAHQVKAVEAVRANNYRGVVVMATGTGKSRVGIRLIIDVVKQSNQRVLLVVPTQLLVQGWTDQFHEVGLSMLRNQHVRIICYSSLHKQQSRYDMIILDEIHKLTELSSEYISSIGLSEKVVGLTATFPSEYDEKKAILQQLKLPIVFQYSLHQASQDGITNKWHIEVVFCTLTPQEHSKYLHICQKINACRNQRFRQLLYIQRQNFIASASSKIRIAKKMIERYEEEDKRIVVFGNTLKTLKQISKGNVVDSGYGRMNAQKFKEGRINHVCSVNILTEGHNLVDVDGIVLMQIRSKLLQTVQKIGRCLRKTAEGESVITVLITRGTIDETKYLPLIRGIGADVQCIDEGDL